MNILVDINHPAHVHFFKHFIWEMQKNGHEVIITATQKDIAFYLLERYGFGFIKMGSYGKSIISKIINLPLKSIHLAYLAKKFNIDLLMGISFRVSHAGWLTGKPSYVFDDTEHATNEIRLYKPFATKIFTPDCFKTDLGPKQVRYPGYHELAYLHPNRFKPNPAVLKEIGLNEGDHFFVVRFVSWGANHDIGQKGFSLEGKRKLIEMIKDKGKIIITSESPLPEEFEPYRMNICPTKMHDLLYFATMYIGEGGTMASESACLGTPAIYANSLTMGYIEELEKKYGLLFRSTDDDKIMEMTENYLNLKSKEDFKNKFYKMINNKEDVVEILKQKFLWK